MALTPKILRLGPYEDWKGLLRGLAISLAAAVFLAFGGAFGTESATLPVRLVYWLGLMILGWIWGSFVSRIFFRRARETQSLWLRILLASLVLSVPFSAVVALAGIYGMGGHYTFAELPELVLKVTAISAVMISINVLAERQGMTSAGPKPAKFLERLPLKLRGGDVWAVEAEDHYLRLHTSKGQDLVLMRLSDAVAELEGIEGAQVHRSWWVAREAITEAVRGDGRATLTLKDGAEVPVSRTYARLLRERGWI
jgi:hypothetical protein